MITIFNKRSLPPGKEGKEAIYIQVSVHIRDYLHMFKGPKLAVFLAITLHMDKEHEAHPSIQKLSKLTGYNKESISKAITDLCKLEIAGQRVLLAYQKKLKGERFGNNQYKIFPNAEEVEFYEINNPHARKPRSKVLQSSSTDTA